MKRLKIIQMLPELNSGGVERGTLEMGRYLVGRGHESLVISAGGRLVEKLESEGSRHIRMSVASKSPLTMATSLSLKTLLEKERPDILHLRSRVPAWVAFMSMSMMKPDIIPSVVTTFHGFHSVNPYSAIMAKGDTVIAVSKTIRDHVKECYGNKGNIRIIQRGVDLSEFSSESVTDERMEVLRKKWGIKESLPPIIMLPGRFTRLKGHDMFMEALGRIRHLPWTAVFVGDHGENQAYAQELKDMAGSLGIRERVIFGGFTSDMPAALSCCDILVSSSLRPESFGRTAVEAMAMERPVIVPRTGGFEETVLHGVSGLLYSPGCADSLATCIEELILSKDKRSVMGMEGRKRVRKFFTLDRMCRKTEEVYIEAVIKKHKKYR